MITLVSIKSTSETVKWPNSWEWKKQDLFNKNEQDEEKKQNNMKSNNWEW